MTPKNHRPKASESSNKRPIDVIIAKYGLAGTITVAFLGLLGAVITAYIALLGIQAPIKATQTAEARAKIEIKTVEANAKIATQTADSSLTQLAAAGTSQPPSGLNVMDFTLTPTNNALWNGALLIRLPTDEELNKGTFTSILDVIPNYGEKSMSKPTTFYYSGKVEKNNEYLMPASWCATSQNILDQNLASISIQFSIDDEKIPDQYVGSYRYKPSNNWVCIFKAFIIGGWQENSLYTIKVTRTLFQKLNDGKSNYPAGDYVYKFAIAVP